jgi:hypothetical protein
MDGDGISDDTDSCPNQHETINGFQDNDGCPDTPPVTEDCNKVDIDEKITTHQFYSRVKGKIVALSNWESCVFNERYLRIEAVLENTRDIKYIIDTYPLNNPGIYQYENSIFLDENEKRNISYDLSKITPTNIHGLKLDVNVAFDYYITKYIMSDLIGFAPSDEKIWDLGKKIKESKLKDTPYLDLYSADGVKKFVIAFASYMQDNPGEFVILAAEAGLSYTESMIKEKISAVLAAVEVITASVLLLYDSFTAPAEETVLIEFKILMNPVRGITVTINVTPQTIEANEGAIITVSGRLSDYQGIGLQGKTVTIDLAGVSSSTATDTAGNYRITLSGVKVSTVGASDVRVGYAGDSVYDAITEFSSINVIPPLPKVKINNFNTDKSEYHAGDNAIITLGFVNSGNLRAHARAQIAVYDPNGKQVDDLKVKEYWLNAAESATATFVWTIPSSLAAGTYTVDA